MRHVYRYWNVLGSDKSGYSMAEITYDCDLITDDGKEEYGKKRKSLQAAINDAKRLFKKYPDAYFGIYAHAVLSDFFDDGTQDGKSDEDCVRLGTLDPNGEYFDLCESVDWLP